MEEAPPRRPWSSTRASWCRGHGQRGRRPGTAPRWPMRLAGLRAQHRLRRRPLSSRRAASSPSLGLQGPAPERAPSPWPWTPWPSSASARPRPRPASTPRIRPPRHHVPRRCPLRPPHRRRRHCHRPPHIPSPRLQVASNSPRWCWRPSCQLLPPPDIRHPCRVVACPCLPASSLPSSSLCFQRQRHRHPSGGPPCRTSTRSPGPAPSMTPRGSSAVPSRTPRSSH
mmetsp:Transcript_111272/g.359206  ORF Transcript_111272/g.359206 Transcript_111272/m.359206 type:complete len:226 (+) Transcript_111272:1044-1721(+)